MIDSKELRIGNWFICEDNELQIDIRLLSNLIVDDDDNIQHCSYPISLTEGWLKRLGFELLPPTTSHHGDMNANFGYPVLWLNKHAYLASNAKTPTGYLFLNGYRIECKYVHQLQNLYFALTGEELQIKNS